MSRPASYEARVGGVRIRAFGDGRGPALAMLHGFTGSARGLAGAAAGLRDRWRTLRVDLVGHGASDAPFETCHYGMERCCEQVLAVLAAASAEPCHLLGYSMGGRVALSLCAGWPERFRSAVLIGASAGLAEPARRAARRASDGALAERIERDGVPDFVRDWESLPLFAGQAGRLSEGLRLALRAERLAQRAHGLAGSLRGMGSGVQPALLERLPSLRVPILCVVGEEDAKFRAVASELVDRLPEARLAVVPAAGHAAHLENPEAFLKEVRAFLDEIEEREPSRSQRPEPRPGAVGEEYAT